MNLQNLPVMNGNPLVSAPTLSDAPFHPNKVDTLVHVAKFIGKLYKAARPSVQSLTHSHHRRSDKELLTDTAGQNQPARTFQHAQHVPLSQAVNLAQNTPGVYILYLDGRLMKCGRAAYGEGVAWRLRQYYNLNYDDRARQGDYWSVSPENRDRVTVSWQCCPASKCRELEYKLFNKYGKGDWAKRAPASCPDNSWELLI